MPSPLNTALAYHAETGRPVFPCAETKRPTCPGGFHAAANDPDGIRELWQKHPGPLLGVPTGEPSGFAVLDIDATKHPEAGAWFWQHAEELKTLTIESRSGGWHCYFQHRPGLTCIAGLDGIKGVDIRAAGGYIIAWGAQGYRTLLQAPVAPWPSWLTLPAENRPPRAPSPPRVPDDASIAKLLRWVVSAGEGERNARVFWAGCRLAEQVAAGTLGAAYAAAWIEQAGVAVGLPANEAKRTAQSALSGRVA
jgi:hypothetical protein